MQLRFAAAGALFAAAMVAACGGSDAPTGPTNPAVASPPRVSSVAVTSSTTNFVTRGQTQQLAAHGHLEQRLRRKPLRRRSLGLGQWRSGQCIVGRGDDGRQRRAGHHFSDHRRSARHASGAGAVRFQNPDPPAGQRLPKPDESAFIVQLFNERPDLVARSCQPESGGTGTWEYMEFVVDRLRLKDTRWGFHSRRGVAGDVARDEVAYHWGPGPDEGSRDSYAWDIMVGHCGPNPQPAWIDVSDSGTLWVSRGRF